jgi:7-cyano-7-deazaguanine synthase
VVIVLSGGLDSSTLAYWIKSKGYEIYPISFNYGQIARKETKSAETIAGMLSAKLNLVDLSSLKRIFERSTALVNIEIPIPSRFEPQVIVPFRNGIFLSISVAYAISINAKKIMYGAQKSDYPFYPDCRKDFVDAFHNAARLGTEKDITIENPFYNFSKADIIRIGKDLKVPYEMTWSCYQESQYHCGACESCVNRKNAFKSAEIDDPTKYIN